MGQFKIESKDNLKKRDSHVIVDKITWQSALDHAQETITELNLYKMRVRWLATATFFLGLSIGILLGRVL